MAYTLLHISDLHRAESDPIGNPELLSSLLADRDRMAAEDPAIAPPDAIVVSGDLVQGTPLGFDGYEAELDIQYEVAFEFLVHLADEFLDGDRSRIAIVPGNHDIDWNCAKAAMELIAESDVPDQFSPAMCGPTSDLRWSWSERRAYRIVDRARYEERLARFDALVDRFYADAEIVHEHLYRLHTLHDDRIAIVAFNSCVGNDCFALHGQIAEEAMANAHLDLRRAPFELCIAVWHHSVHGEPNATDYMSPSAIEGLIGKGFRVGLHGHQHRAAAATRYLHLAEEEVMALISAGSLCAGRWDLPTGVNRQYNVVEIADDLCSARVHVREMVIGHNFAPTRRPEFGLSSFVELSWQLPAARSKWRVERVARITTEAEQAIAEGRHRDAEKLLRALPPQPGGYARNLLLTALQEQRAWDRLVALIDDPSNIAEVVAGTNALIELAEYGRAEAFLKRHAGPLEMPEAAVQDLLAIIAAKRVLR